MNYAIKSISENLNKFCKNVLIFKIPAVICMQLKFKWRSILKRNTKIWLFQKVGKSQNNVSVAEEIGCSPKKLNEDLVIKTMFLDGWMEVKAV